MQTAMDEDPIGVDGELVDRLIAAVNSSHERDWQCGASPPP
jgi:hypothetical protein